MALIFAAIVAAGALTTTAPSASVQDWVTLQASQAAACRPARITARADLVYKSEAAPSALPDKVVVTMEQTQRSAETDAAGLIADDARGQANPPARLLVCAESLREHEAGA